MRNKRRLRGQHEIPNQKVARPTPRAINNSIITNSNGFLFRCQSQEATMPLLTPQQMAEYTDLFNEAELLTHDGPTRRAYRRTIWAQRVLYQQDACWAEQVPSSLSALNNTWIMELVRDITQREDCDEWLESKEHQEDYSHQMKTEERMADLAHVAGYARVMFTSTVSKTWIHPVIKAYWFALSWAPDDREVPLMESTVTSTGHHVTVFPF